MKLKTLLNVITDETLVRIKKPDGEIVWLWMADYIGWYEPVMEEIKPLLNKTFGDDMYLEMCKDPEDGRRVPTVCVDLD